MKSQADVVVMAITAVMLWSIPLLAAGQTFTECNPLQKTCPAVRALGRSANFDFTQGAGPEWTSSGDIDYGSNGASFTVAKQGDNPLIQSNFYIMFGRVEFQIKAAPGTGIVSSAFLLTDCLDEIDWEWLGGDNAQVQTNYFKAGKSGGGAFHADSGNHDTSKTYTIDWNKDRIAWQIDGTTVRTVTRAESAGMYPQAPAFIKIGIWAGGDPSNAPGTIEWAGGRTDYSAGPYTMQVKSIRATDYSTGSQYEYMDNSCSWQSIKTINGQVSHQNSEGSKNSPENKDDTPISGASSGQENSSSTQASAKVPDPVSTPTASNPASSGTAVASTDPDNSSIPESPKKDDDPDTSDPSGSSLQPSTSSTSSSTASAPISTGAAAKNLSMKTPLLIMDAVLWVLLDAGTWCLFYIV